MQVVHVPSSIFSLVLRMPLFLGLQKPEIGIAALMKEQNKNISSFDPIKEAIELDLDLSKEEKQLIKLDEKQVILFYS